MQKWNCNYSIGKREWKLERINLRLTLYSAFWRECSHFFHRIFSSRFVRNSPLAAAAHISSSSLFSYPKEALNMEWEKMMDAQSGTMDDYLNSLFYIFSIILCNLYFKLSSLLSLRPHVKQSWKWLKTLQCMRQISADLNFRAICRVWQATNGEKNHLKKCKQSKFAQRNNKSPEKSQILLN